MSDGSDRLERDVEEVLSNIEDFDWRKRQSRRPGPIRIAFQRFAGALVNRATSLTPNHLLLLGALMLIIGLVLRGPRTVACDRGHRDFRDWIVLDLAGRKSAGQSTSRRLLARSLHQLRPIATASLTTVLPPQALTQRGALVLARFLILFALAAALLVACDGDDPSESVVVEAAQQQQDAAVGQAQSVREQPQSAQQQSGVDDQQVDQAREDSVQDPAADDEPLEQSQTQPIRPGGPPQPDFDVEVANGYLQHLAGVLGPQSLWYGSGTCGGGVPR